MIKARLVSTPLKQDLGIGAYRQVLREGRKAIAASRQASRAKALRYAAFIRARGFTRGYQEGLAAGKAECSAAIEGLRSCYHKALDSAHNDIQQIARELASQIIDTAIIEKPEIFALWIKQATTALKRSKALHLTLNPRYETLLGYVTTQLPEGTTTSLDPAIGSIDFKLDGELGGVEFAWRDVVSAAAAQPLAWASPNEAA